MIFFSKQRITIRFLVVQIIKYFFLSGEEYFHYRSNNALQCWLPKVMATQCFVGKSEELANSCDNPVVVFAKWESLCKVAIVHCADNKVTVELSRTTRVISCVFTISTVGGVVGGGRIKDPE